MNILETPSPPPRFAPPREDGVYRFWRDPVCLGSWALYVLNRFWLVPAFALHWPLLRDHLGDSLLIPAALPPLLWVRSRAGLRPYRGFPSWREIVFWTALSSVFFEFLGPRLLHRSVGDWGDVVAYWVGATVAGLWWHALYAGKNAPENANENLN